MTMQITTTSPKPLEKICLDIAGPLKKGTDSNPGYKLVIPKDCIIDLANNEHLDNDHFGYKKYLAPLKRHYVFPKMERRVRQIVVSSELYQCNIF